jgi:hypothetical protein
MFNNAFDFNGWQCIIRCKMCDTKNTECFKCVATRYYKQRLIMHWISMDDNALFDVRCAITKTQNALNVLQRVIVNNV